MILYHIITQIYQTLKPERSAERQSETKDRLHSAVHRSTALRGMLSDTRLTAAPPETTCEIHRQCIIIKMQRGQTRFIYSLLEGTERQRSFTIVSMYDHNTKTANLYQSSSPPSPTFRLIPTKNGRSSNFKHNYPGTRQNRGIPKFRKKQKVPTGTQTVPTGTYYRYPIQDTIRSDLQAT